MAGAPTSALFTILVVVSIASISPARACRTADAALNYDSKSYIFVGPDYIALDEDHQEESVDNKRDEWGGLDRVDAALNWRDGSSWYHSWYPVFFEGSSYFYYSYYRGATYGPYPVADDDEDEDEPWNHELFLEKGVDATATVGDISVFMKCCNYIIFDLDKREVVEKGHLKDFGLPCNVHAALEMDENVFGVIKNDQLWEVDLVSRNSTGPVDANEAFGLKTIRLCGENEDAGESIHEHPHSESSDEDASEPSDEDSSEPSEEDSSESDQQD